MPPEKTDLKYVWDMLDAVRTAIEITRGKSIEDYRQSTVLRLAVERLIEIIGEAVRRVSAEFRAQHPAIRWSAIMATRHIIAHEYGDIQPDKIWRVVMTHLPELGALLAPIIAANPPAGDPSESKGTTSCSGSTTAPSDSLRATRARQRRAFGALAPGFAHGSPSLPLAPQAPPVNQ